MKASARGGAMLAAILASAVAGCAAPRPVSAAAAAPAGGVADPDGDFPDGWLDGLPADDAAVSAAEGKELVERLFLLVDRKIFDPAFEREARDRARARLLAFAAQGRTRGVPAKEIDAALAGTGMSHLRFLPPAAVRKLQAMTAAPSGARDAVTVTAERIGDVGVLRVTSFLVPSIRRELVDAALARLDGSKALLLDLRGNGGGSTSSTLYVLDRLLGPDRVVSVARFRSGLGKTRPFVQRGALPDAGNEGSAADVALYHREGFVEWRTSPEAKRLAVPAYALVDGGCGSSCDAVAAALRDHGAARLLGARTAGGLLASEVFRPPWKGHMLLVPVGMMYAPSGQVVEGVGVAPDVEIPACVEGKGAACLEAALAVVRGELGSAR